METFNYKLINLIYNHPNFSQRDFSNTLGISLGKTNSILKVLVNKNYIKVVNIDSRTKRYYLTKSGIELKSQYYLNLINESYWIIEKLTLKIKILKKKYTIINRPINLFYIKEQDEFFLKILNREGLSFNLIKDISSIDKNFIIYTLSPKTKFFLNSINIKCINILEEI